MKLHASPVVVKRLLLLVDPFLWNLHPNSMCQNIATKNLTTRLREIRSRPFIPDDGRALAVVEGDAAGHAADPLARVARPTRRQARRPAVPVIINFLRL